MKFHEKNIYVLLTLLIALNITIRLPVTNHEIGVDSFYIHALATSISNFGFANWIIHPASFFGIYPYSYPSASPIILSVVSQSTGISIEYVILILGMVLGIIGTFSVFMLAKEIKDDFLFAFMVAFIFSLAPNFLRFTLWGAVTRSLFMAFFPLFLWLLLRFCKANNKSIVNSNLHKSKTQDLFLGKIRDLLSTFFKFRVVYSLLNPYTFLIILFFIFLVASHRLSFLLPFTFIALFISIFFYYISGKFKRIKIFSNPDTLNVHIFYILFIISIFLFLTEFLKLSPIHLKDFETGYLFRGTDFITIFLNMSIDYTSKVGVLIIFGIIGFISLIGKSDKKPGELFVIFNLMIFLPFLGLETYSPEYIYPFLTIAMGFGLIIILDYLKRYRRLMYTVLIISMLISVGFAFFMIDHWNIYKGGMSDTTYNTALFAKDRANSTLVANSGHAASQITAFSAKPVIPLGGPYANPIAPGQLIYGFVKPEDLKIRLIQPSELSPTMETFYVATNATNAKNEWVSIMENYYWVNGEGTMLSKYGAHLIIENNKQYFYWIGRYSRMIMSLYDSGNKVYTNGEFNVWHI